MCCTYTELDGRHLACSRPTGGHDTRTKRESFVWILVTKREAVWSAKTSSPFILGLWIRSNDCFFALVNSLALPLNNTIFFSFLTFEVRTATHTPLAHPTTPSIYAVEQVHFFLSLRGGPALGYGKSKKGRPPLNNYAPACRRRIDGRVTENSKLPISFSVAFSSSSRRSRVKRKLSPSSR